ncbi:hypothetical protein ACQP00_22845 [Dactylosporangium sp. CS-047395]|uniref:hypothetical protein n=1 Tax=Dactylosporangium sp. CS-047395 TaxID=3239936 RepID=UPI003D909699
MRAMVGVLAVGMIALAGCSDKPAEQSAAASAPASTAATSAAPSPTPSAAPVATPAAADVIAYTVVQPKTLLGRAPATESAIKEQGAKVGSAWGTKESKVSGAYGTTGKKNVILFAASTADLTDPAAFVEQVSLQGFSKYTFHPVDPGMRGSARCADASTAATPTTVCLWADQYATGVIYFFFSAPADAERSLGQARAEIEVDKNK